MSETPQTETPETNAQIYERRTICRVGGIQEVVELVDAEVARKLERERDQAQRDLAETCATNTEIRRELEEARQEAERYRRKTLSQDAEIAKLKASSNENYWELSRQRDNLRFALHKIADAVRYGFRHGTEVLQ